MALASKVTSANSTSSIWPFSFHRGTVVREVTEVQVITAALDDHILAFPRFKISIRKGHLSRTHDPEVVNHFFQFIFSHRSFPFR